jgi:hypothetical protein
LHPEIVILTASTTVPPVTLVVVTPVVGLVVVLVVKLELIKLVALHLPLARTVCGTVPLAAAVVTARKRVKEPLPFS